MAGAPYSIGAVIFIAIKPLIKMVVISLGGAFFARKGVLSQDACRALANVLINLIFPFLIFDSVVSTFDSSNGGAVVAVLVTGAAYQVLGLAFGFFARCFTPIPRCWRGGVLCAGAYYNWGDLIMSYISTLANQAPFKGDIDITRGTAYSSVLMVAQIIAIFNLGGDYLIKRDFRPIDTAHDVEQGTLSSLARKAFQSLGKRSTPKQSAPPVSPAPRIEIETFPEFQVKPNAEKTTSMLFIAESRPFNFNEATASSQSLASHTVYKSESLNDIPLSPSEPPSPPKTTIQKFKAFAKVFFSPPSTALFTSLFIANIPTLRALFITNAALKLPNAPDGQPPLEFVIDITHWVGQAVPVVGMVLLGAALSRLELGGLPKGFWKSSLFMTGMKMVVAPIVGVLWVTQVMAKSGLVDANDKMLIFVLIMAAGVPSATTQVHLTNMAAPAGQQKLDQLSAFSAMLLAQYATMFITLTILVAYTLLNVLN